VRVDDRTFEQRADASAEYAITWSETSVSSAATLELRADADSYDVTIGLTARENGVVVGTRSWHEVIARHLA
jgi:hypothetical protein